MLIYLYHIVKMFKTLIPKHRFTKKVYVKDAYIELE